MPKSWHGWTIAWPLDRHPNVAGRLTPSADPKFSIRASRANGTAMPEDIARLLEEIGAVQSLDELAAIATIAGEIDKSAYDEWTIARVIDALREARERLEPNE